jgi:hypothetical protein
MKEKEIINILKRIEKLETAVFGSATKVKKLAAKDKSGYEGPTGGIRLLIDKGFFDAKRTLADVRARLAENGYHYSIQAAQTGLNRLSKTGGPIVALKEGGKKAYVKRK